METGHAELYLCSDEMEVSVKFPLGDGAENCAQMLCVLELCHGLQGFC